MTFSLTWLPQVLTSAGLKVIETPGWQTRGHGDIGEIKGVLCHHTNGARQGKMPTLDTLINGRPDLAGPLSQLGLGRDGTYYIVCAGKGWHAGAGSWQGVTDGNGHLIGIEGENVGDASDPWPDVQMDAYRRGVAAILKHIGAKPIMCAGHREYALPAGRKDDPNFDMNKFRADVAAIMGSVPIAHRMTGITATVFGGSNDPNNSAYDNHKITDTELGVALPFHFSEPPRVRVFANGKSVECAVIDVGPWNIKDAYWQTGSRPQSESGTDSTGRKTNHAGIDLTPAAAHAIGIEGKGVVDWEFTTNTKGTPMADQPATTAVQVQDPIPEIIALLESARKYLPMISGFLPGGVGPIANAAIPIIEELLQLFEDAKTKSGTDLFHSVGARIETIGKGVQTAAHTAANPPAPSEGMPNS
jgi:hypothetical protein